MKGMKIVVLVALVAAIGGVLYFRFARQTPAAEGLRQEIVARLPHLKGYDKHRAQIDGWIDDAHRAGRAAAGDDGGFDEDLYLNAFIEVLCAQAQKLPEGGKDLEMSLRQFGADLDNEMAARRK
jgi:hypothetical protein